MSQTILVVDDVKNIRVMVAGYLEQEGYAVETAANGREAINIAQNSRPDLIILDLMMPEMGGYEFIREYSRDHETPILILTARLEENDKVLGLELGADDYITKPFSMRELTARIRAVLRRTSRQSTKSAALEAAGISLDREGRFVIVQDSTVDLTPSEFGLLEALMLEPGKVCTRLDLLNHLQGNTYEGYERTIDVHIRNLRSKIEPDAKNPHYIQTVYGVGYRFSTED